MSASATKKQFSWWKQYYILKVYGEEKQEGRKHKEKT